MSEVWCVSEFIADDEDAFVQHLTVTAFIDSNEAEMRLGSESLRFLQETREGFVAGKARVARYCKTLNELGSCDDKEVARIAGVIDHTRNQTQNGLGLIVTRSIHVPGLLRGMKISRRILQEIKRLHNGMPFHYGHSSVPQEMSSLDCQFPRRFEALQNIYLNAGIDLEIPDRNRNPEIMTSFWNGQASCIETCNVNWNLINQNTQTEYLKAA